MSIAIEEIRKSLHEKDMMKPSYVKGYNSAKNDENPFVFPEELDTARMRIGSIPRPLTQEEKDELRRLNLIADQNDWHCWGMGHFRRWLEVYYSKSTKEYINSKPV